MKHEPAFSLVNHSGTKIKKYITLVQIFEEYFRNIIWMKYMFLINGSENLLLPSVTVD